MADTATPTLAVRTTPLPLAGGKSWRLVERNIVVYRRIWPLIVSGFFEPLFYLLSLGVGIGALVKNQVGAIVAALVYLFVVEGLIRSIPATSGAYKWLPGGALEAMTATFQGPDLLGAWQGGLLLVGYGLVAALLGTLLAVRRDVV